MTVVKTLAAVLLLAILAGLAFIYSGIYNIAADEPHLRAVRWALENTKVNSVRRHAEDIVPPADLAQPPRVQAGARMYAQMCAVCHLAPGMDPTPMHQGLKPVPPRLAENPPGYSAAELFWTVKHGYKMTGMPAWGLTHSDSQIWDVVAFLEVLPEMGHAEYDKLTDAQAGGHEEGHHGHTHSHASPEGAKQESQGAAAPAATIEMTDALTYDPRTVEIKRGQTVLWKNPSALAHTVTADPSLANDASSVQLPEGGKPFHSGSVESGGEFRHTFTVAGRYRYFCVPHEAAGMVGEVIVTE